MVPDNQGLKPYRIGFVTDPSLSRERTQIALRVMHQLRNTAEIRYFPGNLTESELVDRLADANLDLLLMPWHMYLKSTKVEAFFGLSRTQGPNVIGWFAEDIPMGELQEEDHHFRAMLIDLRRLEVEESGAILISMLRDSTKWGLSHFLNANSQIHYETWSSKVGLGFRLDAVLEIPEIKHFHWSKRSNAIRTLVTGLWSVLFEHGPGRRDSGKPASEVPNRGYFEVAANQFTLGLRLCYTEPQWKIKDVLHQFWPRSVAPSQPSQILMQYSDLLRVHVDPETNEVEICAFLFSSAPSERSFDSLRSLWVEPLTGLTRLERTEESPFVDEQKYRPLVTHHELIGNAAQKIEQLNKTITTQDAEIESLRKKGSAKENILIYPGGLDGAQLVEILQRRMLELKAKIRSGRQQFSLIRGTQSDEYWEAQKIVQDLREAEAKYKSQMTKICEMARAYLDSKGEVPSSEDSNESLLSSGNKTNSKRPDLSVVPTTAEEEEALALSVAGTQTRNRKKA